MSALVAPRRKELILVTRQSVRDELVRIQRLPILTVDAWLEDVRREAESMVVAPERDPNRPAIRRGRGCVLASVALEPDDA